MSPLQETSLWTYEHHLWDERGLIGSLGNGNEFWEFFVFPWEIIFVGGILKVNLNLTYIWVETSNITEENFVFQQPPNPDSIPSSKWNPPYLGNQFEFIHFTHLCYVANFKFIVHWSASKASIWSRVVVISFLE